MESTLVAALIWRRLTGVGLFSGLLLNYASGQTGSWISDAELTLGADCDINAVYGSVIQLPCASTASLPVCWKYYSQPNTSEFLIVSHNGNIYEMFKSRFIQTSNGTLTIYNVQAEDAGYYECFGKDCWPPLMRVHFQMDPVTTISPVSNSLQPHDKSNGVSGSKIIIIVVVVIPVLVVQALLLLFAKKLRCFKNCGQEARDIEGDGGGNEQHQRLIEPKDDAIELCTSKNGRLTAAAMSRTHILLLAESDSRIRVFLAIPDYAELEQINISGMIPQDIVFCDVVNCFYVADKPPSTIGSVWKLSETFEVKKWLPNDADENRSSFHPNSMSVRSGRLLVISANKDLLLYDAKGQELRRLTLPDFSIVHAAETSTEQFLVCTWEPEMQIVLLDNAGNSTDTKYPKSTVNLNRPYCVQICRDGRVAVTDSANNRIILLDDKLCYLTELTISMSYMGHICFQEHTDKMIIFCRETRAFLIDAHSLMGLLSQFD